MGADVTWTRRAMLTQAGLIEVPYEDHMPPCIDNLFDSTGPRMQRYNGGEHQYVAYGHRVYQVRKKD